MMPSLREKIRYVVFEVMYGSLRGVEKALVEKARELYGESGLAEMGLAFVIKDERRIVVKVNRRWVEQLRFASAMVKGVWIRDMRVYGSVNCSRLARELPDSSSELAQKPLPYRKWS